MMLADVFMERRLKKTLPIYNLAFSKLWVHSVEIGKFMFNWSKMDVAGHLVLLDSNRASVNMLKQASAVIKWLKQVTGLETNARSEFVIQVKRGCMKRVRDRNIKRNNKVRTIMRLDHMKLMIRMFYKKPAKNVSALDRRILVQQMFLYFYMRRHDNIKEITVGDVKVLEDGN